MKNKGFLAYLATAISLAVVLAFVAPSSEAQSPRRTTVTLTADAVTPAASDTVLSVQTLKGDTATGAQTTYPISVGRTLRLDAIAIQFTSSTTTANKVRVRLRTNSGGECVAGSTLVGTWEVSLPVGTLAANQGTESLVIPFPDGMEFYGSASRNICLSAVAAAANGFLSVTVTGFER